MVGFNRTTPKIIFTLFIIFSIILSGCSSGLQILDENTKGQLSKDKLTEAYWNLTQSSIKYASSCDTNVLISPASLYIALTMLTMGTDSTTCRQLEDFLCVGSEKADLVSYAQTLINLSRQDDSLKNANSLWLNDLQVHGLVFNQLYSQFLLEHYDADFKKCKFNENTFEEINLWVTKKTDGKIKNMFEKDSINSESFMILLNAMSFDSQWDIEYLPQYINSKGKFKNNDGSLSTATILSSTEPLYLSSDEATGFLKYYKDKKYALMAMLPNEEIPLSDFINNLSLNELYSFYKSSKNIDVNVKIPCFTNEYSIELKNYLEEMGVSEVFTEQSDFKYLLSSETYDAISTDDKKMIYVNRVLQKSTIDLNDKGTSVASSTAIMLLDSALDTKNTQNPMVYLNRPFIYAIINIEEGIPVFIGTVDSL